MKRAWVQISTIWLFVIVATVLVTGMEDHSEALAWYGAILASSIAAVSLIHLVKASATGIVRELIYVAGGSYLILSLASIYLFLAP
ncbi:MAG: hypothetical protein ACKOOD_01815 [Microbacteriaceae bacterium]